MNKKQIEVIRNNSARLLKHTSKIHRNCIRFSTNNSEWHERIAKSKIAWELQKLGLEYVCEAEFIKGGIADVFILDLCLAVEIMKSEKEDSIKEKRKKYPCEIITFKQGENISKLLNEIKSRI